MIPVDQQFTFPLIHCMVTI